MFLLCATRNWSISVVVDGNWRQMNTLSLSGKYHLGYFHSTSTYYILNHNICLIVPGGPASLVTPSLTCSLAANYHLNFPRPAPIWPCSSVGRAMVICSGGLGFDPHRGQRFSFFLRVGPFSFSCCYWTELLNQTQSFYFSIVLIV